MCSGELADADDVRDAEGMSTSNVEAGRRRFEGGVSSGSACAERLPKVVGGVSGDAPNMLSGLDMSMVLVERRTVCSTLGAVDSGSV